MQGASEKVVPCASENTCRRSTPHMAKHYLVVDVGGTKILAAALAEDGTILARHKLKTDRADKAGLLEQLDVALAAVVQGAKLVSSEIAGVALGVPGVVDSQRGYVVLTPNAPLTDTPLAQLLREKWACPVIVGNDVNVGMAGEMWKGAAQGASSAFGIFVGTGIGGGLFLNGKLVEGARGLSGEIGHFLVPLGVEEGGIVQNKRHLFLEDLCSRTAIENQLRRAILREGKRSILTEIVGDKKLERIRSGALKDALKKNDPLVTDTLKRAAYMLGLATTSVVHLIDPDVIVFGGGVVEACGKWLMPWIEKTVSKVAMKGTGEPVKVVQSKLGDDAILYGGLWLLLENEQLDNLHRPIHAQATPVFASVDKPLQS